jgi:hypothetical protein
MAAQTAVTAQHATLSGTTADTVTFSAKGDTIAVTNRDAATSLYFTYNGATAVSLADDTFVVLPLQTKTIKAKGVGVGVISLVGNGNAYSVETW